MISHKLVPVHKSSNLDNSAEFENCQVYETIAYEGNNTDSFQFLDAHKLVPKESME
jgi:hypothetical protein